VNHTNNAISIERSFYKLRPRILQSNQCVLSSEFWKYDVPPPQHIHCSLDKGDPSWSWDWLYQRSNFSFEEIYGRAWKSAHMFTVNSWNRQISDWCSYRRRSKLINIRLNITSQFIHPNTNILRASVPRLRTLDSLRRRSIAGRLKIRRAMPTACLFILSDKTQDFDWLNTQNINWMKSMEFNAMTISTSRSRDG
jgi:hypothetical protein